MALIELTTQARVKVALGIDAADTGQDAWIDAAIQSMSQRFELFIDRAIEATTRTEEYDVHDQRQKSIFLRTYPVSSITSIKNDPTWDFTNTTALDTDLYRVDSTNGEVHFRADLAEGAKALEVIYTAGLAANTAAFITAFPIAAGAADLQIAAAFRRRSSPQGSAVSGGRGGSITHEAPLQLIPDVVEALIPLRRLRFGV